MSSYGTRLKEARAGAGLSLEGAAERSKAAPVGRGVTRAMISEYERDRSVPGFDVVEALAWAYGCDVSDIESELGAA